MTLLLMNFANILKNVAFMILKIVNSNEEDWPLLNENLTWSIKNVNVSKERKRQSGKNESDQALELISHDSS